MNAVRPSLALARSHIRGVYGITPAAGGEWSLEQVFKASVTAFDEGLKLLQVRQKSLGFGVWADWVQRLGREAEAAGAALILNDALPVAELAQWPAVLGVHLGRDDLPIQQAREVWSDSFVIGASCYNDRVLGRMKIGEGADCIAFGALFASDTKPQAVRAPLDLFDENWSVPAIGIGGLEPRHVPELRAAGVDAFAVVGSLFPKPEEGAVRQAVRAWLEAERASS